MKLIECVPNFSEGRDLNVINEIVASIKDFGVKVLDVDPGEDTNRTVVTFIGTKENIFDAAFAGIKKASELIDMSKHKGAHARMGACDVCPLIPVSGISIEECVELSKKLAQKVSNELNISTFLYEYSASSENRKNLAVIREGEYEGFFEKIKIFKPDFGSEHNVKSGSTVIGVRDFLIAYNINLNTKSVLIARKIANRLREKGYPKRDKNNKLIKIDGKKVYQEGLFKNVKAIGWYIEEYKRAQISINITNVETSPIHEIFEEASKLASKFGVRVTGSELIGLIPKKVIYDAGLFYLKKAKQPYGLSEHEIIETAIQSLGLRELTEFDVNKKIIEYSIAPKRNLISMTVEEFNNELASSSPAPGGGSVAALCGSLSASLVSMLGHLSSSQKYNTEKMKEISFKAQRLKRKFLNIIDDDTDAFNMLMQAFKLPKKTKEEKELRKNEIQKASFIITLIPFSVLKRIPKLLELIEFTLKEGNKSAFSDGAVANLTARTAAYGAYFNVLINLKDIEDNEFVEKYKKESKEIIDLVENKTKELENYSLEYLK